MFVLSTNNFGLVYFTARNIEFNLADNMSELKMNFRHLLSDELKYELRIRGHLNIRTVADMRAKLSALAKATRLEVLLDSTELDVDSEVEVCEDKLNDITQLVSSGELTPSQKERFVSRVIHTQLRLNRLTTEEKELLGRIAVLQKGCESLLNLLNVNVTDKVGLCYVDEPAAAGTSPLHNGLSTSSARTVTTQDSSVGTGELRITIDPSRTVANWNIRYSGRDSKISLHSFLEKVEELSISKNVSQTELLRSINDLLEGSASEWYRFYGKHHETWYDFVNALKEEFLPFSYNRKTLKEIYNRTQHTSESVMSYIYTMKIYFDRLDTPMSEKEQVEIIKDNLAPYYKTKIFCETFMNVNELRRRCKRIEDMKLECSTHVNPSIANTNSLHSDLCFSSKTFHNSGQQRKKTETVGQISEAQHILCNNCKRPGHTEIQCKFNKTIYCYGCGKEGVTRPRCEKCKPQHKNNLNSEGASPSGVG